MVMYLCWHDIIPLGLEFTGLGERFYKLFMGGGSLSLPDITTIAEALR